MFITAVCFMFLIKLRWPKTKSLSINLSCRSVDSSHGTKDKFKPVQGLGQRVKPTGGSQMGESIRNALIFETTDLDAVLYCHVYSVFIYLG